jgi:hypothetical protein
MMTRPEWERFRAHEGKLVEIDLERSPAGSLGEAASAIASLTAEYSVHTERIEVWRYHVKNPPTPENVHDYLVLENLSRHVNVPTFAERASTRTRRSCGSSFVSTRSSSRLGRTRAGGRQRRERSSGSCSWSYEATRAEGDLRESSLGVRAPLPPRRLRLEVRARDPARQTGAS